MLLAILSITVGAALATNVALQGKSSPFAPSSAARYSFSDALPGWAEEGIVALSRRGIIQGYSDGRFGPADSLTRGQIVTLLYRLLRGNGFISPSGTCAQAYRDVPVDHYAFPAVCAMRAQGWLPGGGDFLPGEAATRGEIAALIRGIFASVLETAAPADAGAAPSFRDVTASHPYAPDIRLLSELHVMTGYADGRFGPEDSLNRAQAATVLHRLITLLDERGVEGLPTYNPDARNDERAPDAEPVARLEIPPGALPPGILAADVRIERIGADALAALARDGALAPDGGWALRPDGLILREPVTLVLSLPSSSPLLPLIVHRAHDGTVELVTGVGISYSAEHSLTTVRVPLAHFSKILTYLNSVTVRAPDELGTHDIGDSFPYPVTISVKPPETKPVGRVLDAVFERIGTVSDGGYVTGSEAVTPQRVDSVPDEASVRYQASYEARVTFTCVQPGLAVITYNAALSVTAVAEAFLGPVGVGKREQTADTTIAVSAAAACRDHVSDQLRRPTPAPDGERDGGASGSACRDIDRCEAIRRECEELDRQVQRKIDACEAQWSPDCDREIDALMGRLQSCTKRYDLCKVRAKNPDCLPKYAPSSSSSSSSSSHTPSEPVSVASSAPPVMSRDCLSIIGECEILRAQHDDLQELIGTLAEICEEETEHKRVCLEALIAKQEELVSVAMALDRCKQRNKYRDCWKYGQVGGEPPSSSSSPPAMQIVSPVASSLVPAAAQSSSSPAAHASSASSTPAQALGSWEFLDIDRDWQRVDALPFGHRVHFIVARDPQGSPTFDVRQHLPISIVILVDGASVWQGRIEGDPALTCRDATGCSTDGPVISPSWANTRIEVIAVGRNGELLARHP